MLPTASLKLSDADTGRASSFQVARHALILTEARLTFAKTQSVTPHSAILNASAFAWLQLYHLGHENGRDREPRSLKPTRSGSWQRVCLGFGCVLLLSL